LKIRSAWAVAGIDGRSRAVIQGSVVQILSEVSLETDQGIVATGHDNMMIRLPRVVIVLFTKFNPR